MIHNFSILDLSPKYTFLHNTFEKGVKFNSLNNIFSL